MKHIKDLLNSNIKQSGLSKQIETSLIIAEFEKIIKEIFGQSILERFKAVYIKNKILFVSCGSSALAQELNLQKGEILNRVNNKYDQAVLQDIKLQV